MSRPVVLRSFLNPNDAYLVKMILEDAGIPVFLYDEYASGSGISYTYAMGGVKVAVPESYAEAALEIIEQDFADSKNTKPSDDHKDQICPKCGSDRIYNRNKYTSFFEIILFFLAGIFFQQKKNTKYQCRDCKHTWRGY